MTRFALVAALTATLLSLSTGVSAYCFACSNCIPQGSCLDSWTCSGNTITCYYPSATDPGTLDGCVFTGTLQSYGYDEFVLTGGPAVCDEVTIGDNAHCEPYNDPWETTTNACTGSYAYVGEDARK